MGVVMEVEVGVFKCCCNFCFVVVGIRLVGVNNVDGVGLFLVNGMLWL